MWCAIEFVTELTVYGETWYEHCNTENHSEVAVYNFPQSEIVTSQTVPNINFKMSMQILCALFERYSDTQLYYNMLQNRMEISHLFGENPMLECGTVPRRWREHKLLSTDLTTRDSKNFQYLKYAGTG